MSIHLTFDHALCYLITPAEVWEILSDPDTSEGSPHNVTL